MGRVHQGKRAGRAISFSRGRGKVGHNRRTFLTKNVDPNRVKNNIIIKQQDIGDAYDEIFGEVQRAYDAKQKRAERKIGNYYVHLFGEEPRDEIVKGGNRGRQQNFYEYVIGVGDRDDTGYATNPEMAAVAEECIIEYFNGNPEAGVKSFEERNPNFHLTDAIIHCDESTPHAHFDIIPWSSGYKKGMSRQQGINRALEAMGYGDNGSKAIAAWTKSERQVFREICERHGIEVAVEEKGRGFDYTVEDYKKQAELKKSIEDLAKKRDEEIEIIKEAGRMVLAEQEDKIAKAANRGLQQLKEIAEQIEDKQFENAKLNEQIADKRSELKDLDEQIVAALEIPPRPQLPPPLPPDEPRPMREHRPYTREEEKELTKAQKQWDKDHSKGGKRWTEEQEHAAETARKVKEGQAWDERHQPLVAAKNVISKNASKERELAARERQTQQAQQQIQAELERGRAENEKAKRALDKREQELDVREQELDVEVARKAQERLAQTDKYQQLMTASAERKQRMDIFYKGKNKSNQKAFDEKVKAMRQKGTER